MTENETTDQNQRQVSIPRGSGALIGRFLAVGLFVALGTFAVIQSLSASKEPQAKLDEFDNDASLAAKLDEEDDQLEKEKIVKSTTSFGGPVANTTPSMDKSPIVNKLPPVKKTGAKFQSLKPATAAAPRQTTGTFGKPGVGVPPASKTPPPPRFAQLPTGSARSSYGIGGATPAKTSPQVLGNAVGNTVGELKGKVDSAATGAVNRFKSFGSGIQNKATDVTSRAKSAFGAGLPRDNSTAGSATKPDNVPITSGSPFGQRPNPIKPIEAKSSIDSINKRPFETTNQPKPGGFQSRPLNPIANTATQQPRTPANTATTRPRPTFPAKSGTPAPLPRDPFTSRAKATSVSTAATPPPARRATPTVRATQASVARGPAMQANRVSPKPGDRQYEGVQAPSMIIQKSSPREIQVNQTADFEVKIRNVGRVSVDDVLVVDQIPTGAEFVDANPKPTSQSRIGELQWQLGTMKPGEERTILLQVKPTEPGEIGSVAQFFFGGRATNRTKVTQPKLKISHTADPKILVGDNVVFDVIVENTGNGPAKDVIIQEEVPELLEYQDGSRELEYEVGTLLPGQSRRVQLGLKAARVGRMRNVMFASAKGGLQAKHETDIEIIAPKLETSSDGATTRYIERDVSHTFSVLNKGTAAAKNLRMIARLPSGLRYVSSNNRGRYDRSSHSVIWQMRDLAAGGSGNVEIKTTPIEVGDQNIKFEAVADLNQRSETVQNLKVKVLIDIFFDIDDVIDPIEIGNDTRYRIRMVNQGSQDASNVQLQVDFPPGLEPTAVDGDLRNQIRGQQILFEPITNLRAGEELRITVQAKGRSAGDHRIVVNMKADGRDTPVSKEETTRVYSDR